jgi:hypothetical protein
MDDNDLTRRALAAWFRAGGTEQPANTSGMVSMTACTTFASKTATAYSRYIGFGL